MCFLTSIMDHPPSLPTLNLYRSPFSPAVRPSESLTTGLFLAGLGCGLAQCDGGGLTGGDVPLQSVPLFTPDSWTSHINQICRSAHMSNQRDIWWLLHRKNCQHRTACLRYTLHHPDAFLQVSVQTLILFPLTLTAFMFFFFRCSGEMWQQREDLEKEEVIFGPSDGLPPCLGNPQGYVRHCDRRTGTKDKTLFPSATYNLKDEMVSYFQMIQLPNVCKKIDKP